MTGRPVTGRLVVTRDKRLVRVTWTQTWVPGWTEEMQRRCGDARAYVLTERDAKKLARALQLILETQSLSVTDAPGVLLGLGFHVDLSLPPRPETAS